MLHSKHASTSIAILFLLVGASARAQPEPDNQPDAETSVDSEIMEHLDRRHQKWSTQLERSARKIDAFFDEPALVSRDESEEQVTP